MHASLCFDRLFGFSLRFFRGSVSQFSKLNELHRNEWGWCSLENDDDDFSHARISDAFFLFFLSNFFTTSFLIVFSFSLSNLSGGNQRMCFAVYDDDAQSKGILVKNVCSISLFLSLDTRYSLTWPRSFFKCACVRVTLRAFSLFLRRSRDTYPSKNMFQIASWY